jgi:hypothetical protein
VLGLEFDLIMLQVRNTHQPFHKVTSGDGCAAVRRSGSIRHSGQGG